MVKIDPSMKGAICMVPRHNLGGNSIYTIYHDPPYAKVYFPQKEDKASHIAGAYAHSVYKQGS